MRDKMKILIYLNSLTAGGAEKVASLMANHWCSNHEVILLTDASIDMDFFTIDQKVKRFSTNFCTKNLTIIKKMYLNITSLRNLRNFVRKHQPDIIISHMDVSNVRISLAVAGLKIPVIIEEHNNPSMLRKLPQPWRFIQPWVYNKLTNTIVLLTTDLKQYYAESLQSKICIIPNPLNIPKDIPESNELTLKNPTFIALGSLTKQKGFDYLLQAFEKVSRLLPEWNLTILGEGPLRNELTEYAAKLGIAEKVHMPGIIKNPYAVLKDADIFVMSSRYEGFPVALCEAMGVGLPCISFNCPTGPADIIEHNVNGILVEYLNIESLVENMTLLANDPFRCQRLSSEALKINEKLHISKIMAIWNQLIQNVQIERTH